MAELFKLLQARELGFGGHRPKASRSAHGSEHGTSDAAAGGSTVDAATRAPAIPSRSGLQCASSLVRRLELVGRLDGHGGCVNSTEYSDDGTLVVTGSDDTAVGIWCSSTRACLAMLTTGHSNNIFHVKFVPGSGHRRAVSLAADGGVRLLDVGRAPNGRRPPQVTTEDAPPRRRWRSPAVPPSPPSAEVLLGSHGAMMMHLAWLPDCPHAFLGTCQDGCVRLYDIRAAPRSPGAARLESSGGVVVRLATAGAASDLVFDPRRPCSFALGCDDPYVRVFDLRLTPGTGAATVAAPPACVARLAPPELVPSGDRGGGPTRGDRRLSEGVSGLDWSPWTGEIVATYRGAPARLFSASAASGLTPLPPMVDGTMGEPDAPWATGGGVAMTYRGGRNERTFLKQMRFVAGGEYVATGTDGGHVMIWHRSSGVLCRRLRGDSSVVNCVAGRPGTPDIAASGIDDTVKIFAVGETTAPWAARSQSADAAGGRAGAGEPNDDDDDDDDGVGGSGEGDIGLGAGSLADLLAAFPPRLVTQEDGTQALAFAVPPGGGGQARALRTLLRRLMGGGDDDGDDDDDDEDDDNEDDDEHHDGHNDDHDDNGAGGGGGTGGTGQQDDGEGGSGTAPRGDQDEPPAGVGSASGGDAPPLHGAAPSTHAPAPPLSSFAQRAAAAFGVDGSVWSLRCDPPVTAVTLAASHVWMDDDDVRAGGTEHNNTGDGDGDDDDDDSDSEALAGGGFDDGDEGVCGGSPAAIARRQRHAAVVRARRAAAGGDASDDAASDATAVASLVGACCRGVVDAEAEEDRYDTWAAGGEGGGRPHPGTSAWMGPDPDAGGDAEDGGQQHGGATIPPAPPTHPAAAGRLQCMAQPMTSGSLRPALVSARRLAGSTAVRRRVTFHPEAAPASPQRRTLQIGRRRGLSAPPGVPDYVLRPQSYTRYELTWSDDDDDTSNATAAAAALQVARAVEVSTRPHPAAPERPLFVPRPRVTGAKRAFGGEPAWKGRLLTCAEEDDGHDDTDSPVTRVGGVGGKRVYRSRD